MSLASKLVAVGMELGAIHKDKTNDFHRYNYVSAEKFIEIVREPLMKEGIAIIPNFSATWKDQPSPKGAPGVACHLTAGYTITDGEESIVASVVGEGWDSSGDKSCYKAMTGAHKYLLRILFNLPMTDDPENDAGHRSTQQATRPTGEGSTPSLPPPDAGNDQRVSEKQAKFLHVLCKKKCADPEATKQAIYTKFGIHDFAELHWKHGKELIDTMAAKPDYDPMANLKSDDDMDLDSVPF